MAAKASTKETTVAEKLDALYALQKIDSQIDKIRTVRGELPLEVQDLEDEIEGLETRIKNLQEEAKELDTEVADRKMAMKDAEAAIVKFKDQQNNVRNNREFESLAKEIEYQELEIKLHDKRMKEAKIKISSKKEVLDEAKERLEFRKGDLKVKQDELNEIVGETQKEEDALIAQSEKAKALIDARIIEAYDRLRTNAKNGLAVVGVDRDSCGGCFNKIPPQRQLDIDTRRKVIVCEHCGRILVPADVVDAG
ncbi:C4-type zinc ribbon domain-containing protein [Fluviicola taffensis]|uniref:zinc ribbon domain-containing protein n=1 Tax=Fluviicola taffensis TaxID=191579 RepID=UPI003137BF47